MKKTIKLFIVISCVTLTAFVFCGMPTASTFFSNEFNTSTSQLDSEIMAYIDKLQQKTITDNQNIINDYQQKIDEISQKYLNISDQLANSLGDEFSHTHACKKIVTRVAKDKLRGSNSTEEYLNDKITTKISSLLQQYSNEMKSIFDEMQNKIKQNNKIFIQEVCNYTPEVVSNDTDCIIPVKEQLTANVIVKSLEIADVLTIMSPAIETLKRTITSSLASISKRTFLSAAKYIPLSVIDGLLPIMDLYAAHKIKRKIKKAKHEFGRTIRENVSQALEYTISEHNVIFKHSVQEIGKQYQELIEQSFEQSSI